MRFSGKQMYGFDAYHCINACSSLQLMEIVNRDLIGPVDFQKKQ
jgi:hypothetical protein